MSDDDQPKKWTRGRKGRARKQKTGQPTRYRAPRLDARNYDLENPADLARHMMDRENTGLPSERARLPNMATLRRAYPLCHGNPHKTPQELAALDRHRAGTQFGGPNLPVCKAITKKTGKPCRMVRVRNSDFCRHHGGRKELIADLKRRGAPTQTTVNIRINTVSGLLKRGLVPVEVTSHPVFQRLMNVKRASRTRFPDMTPHQRYMENQKFYQSRKFAHRMIAGYFMMQDDPTNSKLFYDTISEALSSGLI
jgi:hypothetical protein